MNDSSSNMISFFGQRLSHDVAEVTSQLETIASSTSDNNRLLEKISKHQKYMNNNLEEMKDEAGNIKGEAESIKDEIKRIALRVDNIER